MPMPTKTVGDLRPCSMCKEIKPLSEFDKKGKYYRGDCRICRVKKIKEIKEWMNSFKEVPCADCGKQFPAPLMDFDHIPERGPKLGKVGSFLSKKKILEEIEKCEVVCAMCHRIRTMNRLGLLTEEDFNVISKL